MKEELQNPLPRWRDLPDLGLYMDQVLMLIGRTKPVCAEDASPLTASMVHNYVKLGVMPPPVKKKYAREHLAYLMIICILKPILPLNGIGALIRAELSTMSMESLYDAFCAEWDRIRAAVRPGVPARREGLAPVFSAALLSAAQRQAALSLLGAASAEPGRP